MKYVSFTWLRLEVSLPIFNVSFCCQKQFFEKELIKKKETAMNAES